MRLLLIFGLIIFSSCGLMNAEEDNSPRQIVFSALDGDHYQIFTMKEDGSGLRQLTDFKNHSSVQPTWNPDGTRIAFSSSKNSPGATGVLWVMDANGGNKEILINNPRSGDPQFGNYPAWSPDGTKIAFEQCLNCEGGGSMYTIFVIDINEGSIDTLLSGESKFQNPSWRPDGTHLSFDSNLEDIQEKVSSIYMVDLSTEKIIRLTENDWSKQIIWLSNTDFLYWSYQIIYKSSVSGYESEVLPIRLSNVSIGPQGVSKDGNKLLLKISPFNQELDQSLQFFDLNDNTLTKFISFHRFQGVDWLNDQQTNN